MGTQKLGLNPDESFDSEENLERAAQDDRNQRDEAVSRFILRLGAWHRGWILVATCFASFLFLCDWGGYRGKFAPWGDPKALSDIWWHFPLILATTLVVFGTLASRRE